MDHMMQERPAPWGMIGFILGVVSLLILLVQMSALFEPQPKSTGQVIGEIAADIKQSAARALSGEPAPEPEPVPTDYTIAIVIGALCLAGAAVVAGGVGLYRHEPHRLSYLAIGFGMSAFVAQFVFWLAVVICGTVLLVTIVKNLDMITE
ncbi:MAG: hypothetical protein AAF340_07865 [Pseudomonadota bacterium]